MKAPLRSSQGSATSRYLSIQDTSDPFSGDPGEDKKQTGPFLKRIVSSVKKRAGMGKSSERELSEEDLVTLGRQRRKKNFFVDRLLQFKVLLKKNWWITIRSWRSLAIQVFSGVLFVIFLFVLQEIFQTQLSRTAMYPQPVTVQGLPHCKEWGGKRCHALLYAVEEQHYIPPPSLQLPTNLSFSGFTPPLRVNERPPSPSASIEKGGEYWATFASRHDQQPLFSTYLPASRISSTGKAAHLVLSSLSALQRKLVKAVAPFHQFTYSNDFSRPLKTTRDNTNYYSSGKASAYGGNEAQEAIETFAKRNDPPLSFASSLDKDGDIVKMDSYKAIYDFVAKHPNRTNGAVIFYTKEGRVDSYKVMFNVTPALTFGKGPGAINDNAEAQDLSPLIIRGIDEALLTVRAKKMNHSGLHSTNDKGEAVISAALNGYPNPKPRFQSNNVVAVQGAVWFYCPPMFVFIILMNSVVMEKEKKLRQAMRVMGMKDSMFWLSWVAAAVVIEILAIIALFIAGLSFQFDFFLKSNFAASFILFLLFGISMIPFAFFVSTFIARTKTSNTVGFIIFLLGFFLQVIFSGFAVYFWFAPGAPLYIRAIFTLWPAFNFAKGFADINTYASDHLNTTTGSFQSGPGFSWADLYRGVPVQIPGFEFDAPAPVYSYYFLMMNAAIFALLAWYFDNLFSGDTGTRRPFYFPLTLSYWGVPWPFGNPFVWLWWRTTGRVSGKNSKGSDPVPRVFYGSTGAPYEGGSDNDVPVDENQKRLTGNGTREGPRITNKAHATAVLQEAVRYGAAPDVRREVERALRSTLGRDGIRRAKRSAAAAHMLDASGASSASLVNGGSGTRKGRRDGSADGTMRSGATVASIDDSRSSVPVATGGLPSSGSARDGRPVPAEAHYYRKTSRRGGEAEDAAAELLSGGADDGYLSEEFLSYSGQTSRKAFMQQLGVPVSDSESELSYTTSAHGGYDGNYDRDYYDGDDCWDDEEGQEEYCSSEGEKEIAGGGLVGTFGKENGEKRERRGKKTDRNKKRRHKSSDQVALQIIALNKRFRKYPFINTRKDVQAVNNLCLTVEEGQVFCLLGHNGAGKTTTINILTGLFPPSAGDAFIYGRSVTTEQDDIREMMGVCPQHDILWEELTARETLEIFATLRSVPNRIMSRVIDAKLKEVELYHVRKSRAGTFSGGMKRRLSVAASSIGEPKIIFLDEPTTGLDPVSRRRVWNLVEKIKKGRALILTTHSMEEADLLADRIGIMAFGQLKCVGTSLYLKNHYGDGYRVNFVTHPSKADQLIDFVQEILPAARLQTANAGSVTFELPKHSLEQIPEFFERLEEEDAKELMITYGLSHTSLEEVFHNVTERSQHAKEGQKEEL